MGRFQEKYRALIQRRKETLPDGIWEEINQQLNAQDEKVYDYSLNKEDLDKDINEVWDKISRQLDIDEVWGVINKKLDEKEEKKPIVWFYTGVVASLVLLLLLVPEIIKNGELFNVSKQEFVSDIQKTEERKNVIEIIDVKEATIIENSVLANSGEGFGSDVLNTQSIICGDTSYTYRVMDISVLEEKNIPSFQTQIYPKTFKTPMNNDYSLFLEYYNDLYSGFDEPEKESESGKWSLGLLTSLKNSYLLNSRTISGFESNQLHTTQLSFVPEVGLNVHYRLNNNFSMQSVLFVSSKVRQKYTEYYQGEYVERNLNLNYAVLEYALLHTAKRSFTSAKNVIRQNVVGLYMGYLRTASASVNEVENSIADEYTKFDCGLKLGQNFQYTFNKQWHCDIGILAKYGVPNIFSGNSQIPSHLNKTHNLAFEVRVGFRYSFKTSGTDQIYMVEAK